MRIFIINDAEKLSIIGRVFKTMLKFEEFNDCSRTNVIARIKRENPSFIHVNFNKPVNGDDDIMAMLSSMDVNTRLRVFIFKTEILSEIIKSVKNRITGFILPGRDLHKLDTP
jgi:hypothetical protein